MIVYPIHSRGIPREVSVILAHIAGDMTSVGQLYGLPFTGGAVTLTPGTNHVIIPGVTVGKAVSGMLARLRSRIGNASNR